MVSLLPVCRCDICFAHRQQRTETTVQCFADRGMVYRFPVFTNLMFVNVRYAVVRNDTSGRRDSLVPIRLSNALILTEDEGISAYVFSPICMSVPPFLRLYFVCEPGNRIGMCANNTLFKSRLRTTALELHTTRR